MLSEKLDQLMILAEQLEKIMQDIVKRSDEKLKQNEDFNGF